MKKILSLLLLIVATNAIAQTDSFVQLPPNSTGVKLRMRCNTISANVVCSQGFFLDDGSGSGALGLVGNPIFTTFTNSAMAATQSGTWNLNNISGTVTLPTGAATETTIAGIKTGTDRIPSSPATDRATAVAPFSIRLSDGAVFYKATTPSDTQPISAASLPLPGGAATETTLAGIKTGTDKIPASPATDRTAAASPFAVRLSDGAAFFDPRSIRALTSSDVITVANTAFIANAGTNLNTAALALESGGHLASIDAKDFATQTTLALIKAKTDNIPSDPSREGGVLATATKQDTGNTSLGSIKTNTDPLVASGAGGYVRQDSTTTIAKETGGNLATIATNTTGIATAANQTTVNAGVASIDLKTPALINGGSPVTIVNIQQVLTPPVLTAQQLSNPLLLRAAMKQFCSTNLCPTFGR